MDEYIYGQCLIRVPHKIHIQVLRLNQTKKKIYANKTDLYAAFWRIHVLLKYSLLCITIIGKVGYILSRCQFGVNEGPDKFCIASEITIDLAQEIAENKPWNPETLRSPRMDTIRRVRTSRTFTNTNDARETNKYRRICRRYHHDNVKNGRTQNTGAVLLALHTIFRPTSEEEPITTHDVLSPRKMLVL